MYLLEILINVFLILHENVSSLDSQPVFLRTMYNEGCDVTATYSFECMMETLGL